MLFPLTPALSLGERFSPTTSRFKPLNHLSGRPEATLSPIGGKGRVRGLRLSGRFMGRGNAWQSLMYLECHKFAKDLPTTLPLPKGEGRGEGECGIRKS